MHQIDDKFLESLGLGALPQDEKEKMKLHIYETLEMRVGIRLASQMSEEQLNEFEVLMNNQDDAGALKWLETNFPDYKQVVADELDKLKNEIKEVAPQIVASASGGQQTAMSDQTATPDINVMPAQEQSQQPPVYTEPQQPTYQQPPMPPTPDQNQAQQ